VALEAFGDVPSYTALWLNDLQTEKEMNQVFANKTVLADGRYEMWAGWDQAVSQWFTMPTTGR